MGALSKRAVFSLETIKRQWHVWFVASAVLANGVFGIVQILTTRISGVSKILPQFFPYGVHHWSRLLTLVFSFTLVYLAIHLFKRKEAAWWLSFGTLVLISVTYIDMDTHYPQGAIATIIAIILLILSRKEFRVRSEPRNITRGIILMFFSIGVAILYGSFGFFLLDKKDFGIDFRFIDAVWRTIKEYTLIGNSDISPITRQGDWFLDSLSILGITAWSFALFSLFRPLAYRLRISQKERARVKRIIEKHGHSALDFFALWPDKSYFFSKSGNSVIAYGVSAGVAIALGDPLGPREEVGDIIEEFYNYCKYSGWDTVFMHTFPEYTHFYKDKGFRVIKVGEEAIIDIKKFLNYTSENVYFRKIERRMQNHGMSVVKYTPPYSKEFIHEIALVSGEWLSLSGRRERSFSLGYFTNEYIRSHPLFVVKDSAGSIVAFANEIPSYRKGEATIDMMRHRIGAVNGTMDYLFMKVMLILGQEGYVTFNLGLAPLAGIEKRKGVTPEERIMRQIFAYTTRFFSFKGLREYKNKFEPIWEERFLAYRGGITTLPKAVIALEKLSKV